MTDASRPAGSSTDPATGRPTAAFLLRTAVTMELDGWRSLYRWIARRPRVTEPGAEAFGYLEPVSVIIWAFIGVSAVEVPVVHFILPWHTVRIIALVIGIWGLIWMFGYLASLKVHPHVVGRSGLRVRNGAGIDIMLPWDEVDAIRINKRALPTSKTVQLEETPDGTVLQLGISSQTNVHLALFDPTTVMLPRGPVAVTELRFFADDPKALVISARRHLAASAQT
ncbi:hypothetical protein [Jiangella asiatica]|uniref:PH domain-containing protein n=1 Tax=Jiangella asiatica TaxID=2530372 RepID=A0A4V2YZ34_9ACTN|nr:hypothetical protein [Jiangella asiatica]TDD95417.1 hypothetical protein E1269_31205 [Jiangella asiatica]